jgi:Domain of unknown function (DUF4916)
MYGESLSEAIQRQVIEALGGHIKLLFGPNQQPLYIAQYSPERRKPFAFDPRQHSVGLTYAVEMAGIPTPGGEGFKIADVPRARQFGFGQSSLVKTCLDLLKTCPLCSPRRRRSFFREETLSGKDRLASNRG